MKHTPHTDHLSEDEKKAIVLGNDTIDMWSALSTPKRAYVRQQMKDAGLSPERIKELEKEMMAGRMFKTKLGKPKLIVNGVEQDHEGN